ncbi:hypothetical protein BB561_000811 [Smittium simulii]|uniref:ABC1 atypical kinase-like domain-containing protein n=1 Tax=Smittium simulii TaxID=133385 RepID=A0A2T9YXG5_9FUNG|nr:hypothetical protein BB561_000811 [Smittium simulii]
MLRFNQQPFYSHFRCYSLSHFIRNYNPNLISFNSKRQQKSAPSSSAFHSSFFLARHVANYTNRAVKSHPCSTPITKLNQPILFDIRKNIYFKQYQTRKLNTFARSNISAFNLRHSKAHQNSTSFKNKLNHNLLLHHLLSKNISSGTFQNSKPPKKKKFLMYILALLVCGYSYDTFFMYNAVQRSLRTLFYTALVSADYYFNFNENKTKQELEALHQRNADRLLYVCIGLQGSLLPPQFQKTLSLLFDKAPTISQTELENALKESYPGMSLDDIFVDFSKEAVASASIAQVHKARLKSNPDQWVAVKVQKPAIRKQLELDLFIYRCWCKLIEYRFDFPIMWSVPYTIKHFRMETNFIREGKNAELALDVINTDPNLASNVYVPKVFWDLSTKSVLVTEWIDGNSLVDTDTLKQVGWDFKEIMGYVVKAFAQQLFVSGHLHGDPHPGNIIIRQNPNFKKKKVQVVIIDHGLYINESETFRKQYCKFWKSIFLQDSDTMRQISDSWGIKDSGFLSSMVLFRPPDSHLKRFNKIVSNKSKPNSSDNNSSLILEGASEYEKQMSSKQIAIKFFSDSSKLPPELVFVMRNMNMIRSNNKALGSPVNRIKVMANYAAFGSTIDNDVDYETNVIYKLIDKHKTTLYDEFGYQLSSEADSNLQPQSKSQKLAPKTFFNIISFGYFGQFILYEAKKLISYFHFRASLLIIDSVFYYTKFLSQISSLIFGTQVSSSNANFEVVLDKAMIANIEEKLGYKIDPDIFNA